MNKKRLKMIVIDVLLILSFIGFMFFMGKPTLGGQKDIPYNQFLEMIDKGKVESVEIGDTSLNIKLIDDNTRYHTGYVEYNDLVNKLYDSGIEFTKVEESSFNFMNLLLSLLLNFGPLIFMFWLLTKTIPQIAGKGVTQKPVASASIDKNTGVTFADVAGQEEAKDQLSEIIDFLHNPKKYQDIGAKIPKGALLIGPPGTGKTLLAKAVAGEAKVPFFSVTGSDFIEMYVGVGASRIRELFEQAKQNAPCIIFIDEVDSIAKTRDSGMRGGANDERDQTLNQLLSEMDGFDSSKGIVILAATNRPEILDKAFLRAGRFDRKVIVERPDLQGRIETLKVHSKKVKLDESVDFNAIAYATTGCVGADLENIVNEAALRAVKMGRKQVSQEDLMESVETVIAGKEKKNRVMSEKERQLVAYHEVGHAVVAAMQNNTSPVQKITIIPRTKGSLGYTLQVPEEEKFLSSKEEMLEDIITFYGGRCAEEVFFNTTTTGASNDIERATEVARQMVTLYGMTDRFDLMSLESIQNTYLDGTPVRNCSEATSTIIDEEVLTIVKKCHAKAMELIKANKELITEVAEFLLKKESITGEEFMEIFNSYHPDKKLKVLDPFTSKKVPEKHHPALNVEKEKVSQNRTKIPESPVNEEKPIVREERKQEPQKKVESRVEPSAPKKEEEKKPEPAKEKPIKLDPPKEKAERPAASVLGPKKNKKKKNKATAEDMQNLLSATQKKEEEKKEPPKLYDSAKEELKTHSKENKLPMYEGSGTSKQEAKPQKQEEKPTQAAEPAPQVEVAGRPKRANPDDYANNKDLDDISEDMF